MPIIIVTLAQFVFILWPLFIITALVYSFQGRQSLSTLIRRVRRNLLITWLILFIDWVITLFAESPASSLIPEPWNTFIFFTGLGLLVLAESSRLGLFRRRLFARIDLHHTRDLRELQSMEPYAFENLVAETYRALGYSAKQVGHSGDHGIDIELRAPGGERWIVQCKRYHGSVGESIVRDLYGTMVSEKAARAILVTTAETTPPAEAWARGKPIELVDGHRLLRMIDQARQASEGTIFDRLAHWLDQHGVTRDRRPSGLRTPPASSPPASDPLAPTQKVRISPNGHKPVAVTGQTIRYVHGRPICPNCGLPMVPHPASPNDRPGRSLFRCRNYPSCRVVLERKAL